MDNIVLLTDFSPASLHAAGYAASLTFQYSSSKLVLCHTHQTAEAGHTVETGLEGLKELHRHLLPFVHPYTSIRYRSEEGLPAGIINKVALTEHASLVITGLNMEGGPGEWLTGKESQNVPDTCLCPVLLVPRAAIIAPVSKVVFACDLEDMQDTIEQSALLQVLDSLHASLTILHVEKPGKGFSPATMQQLPVIQRMLSPYNPAYFYLEDERLQTGVTRFVKEQKASLVIVVRKRKGLFSQSFHTSLTRALTIKTHIPLLVLHAIKNYPVRKI